MDLRKVTTFTFPQCPLPLQQHDRELASFRPVLTQISLATIAKNRGMSKMTAENSRERRNKSAMAGRIPRKNIPNAQPATKLITRRNGVGKALEPTSIPKTSNWIIPKPRKPPRDDSNNKPTTSILKNSKN